MDAAFKLSEAYEKAGDTKKALELMHVYDVNKDSLINEKNSSNTEEMQVMYRSSQKDKEIEQLSGEKKLNDAELSRSRTIIISAIGAAVFVLILVFVLWRGNSAKRKANLELAKAYRKIEHKNLILLGDDLLTVQSIPRTFSDIENGISMKFVSRYDGEEHH